MAKVKYIMRKKKSYANGTGVNGLTVANYLENPATELAQNQINIAKGQENAASNPWTKAMQMLGGAAMNYGINNFKGFPGSGEGGTDAPEMANGGPVGSAHVEVENKEVGEMPNGEMMEFKGATHENGGINAQLPIGTDIYSERIKVKGVSMADRKKAREKAATDMQAKLDANPTDKILKDTLGKILTDNEKADATDKQIQQAVDMVQKSADNMKAYGGKVKKSYNNGGIVVPEQVAPGSDRLKELQALEAQKALYDQSQSKFAPLVKQFGEPTAMSRQDFFKANPGFDESMLGDDSDTIYGFDIGEDPDDLLKNRDLGAGYFDQAQNKNYFGGKGAVEVPEYEVFDHTADIDMSIEEEKTFEPLKAMVKKGGSGNTEFETIGETYGYQSDPTSLEFTPGDITANDRIDTGDANTQKLVNDFLRKMAPQLGPKEIPSFANGGTAGINPDDPNAPNMEQLASLFAMPQFQEMFAGLNGSPDLNGGPDQVSNEGPFASLTQGQFPGGWEEYQKWRGIKDQGGNPSKVNADGTYGDTGLSLMKGDPEDPFTMKVPTTGEAAGDGTGEGTPEENQVMDFLKNSGLTGGNIAGLAGNAVSSLGPLLNTLKNRAGDTPNINAYEEYGKEGIDAINQAMQFADDSKVASQKALEEKSESQRVRNRNSARGVNTMRALDLQTEANANMAENQIHQNFAQTMSGLLGTLAQLENQQDQVVMGGEANRDLADRQDRDIFSTNLGRDIGSLGTGLQQTGKDLNQIKQQQTMMKLLNQFSKYGITVDGSGNLGTNG